MYHTGVRGVNMKEVIGEFTGKFVDATFFRGLSPI